MAFQEGEREKEARLNQGLEAEIILPVANAGR